MKPTRLLDRAITPDGAALTLHEHDDTFSIRVGGVDLMSTRQHHSEERMAALACAGLRDRRRAVELVGGRRSTVRGPHGGVGLENSLRRP